MSVANVYAYTQFLLRIDYCQSKYKIQVHIHIIIRPSLKRMRKSV